MILAIFAIIASLGWLANYLPDKILQNVEKPFDAELPTVPFNPKVSSGDVQFVGGQGLGISCSIPWPFDTLLFSRSAKEAPIGLHMRQVCASHDFCYRHGAATYGYSQSDCDQLLQVRAFRLCRIIRWSVSVEDCESEARRMTLALMLAGYGPFQQALSGPEDVENVSSYFEFESFPVRSTRYAIARIADTPRTLKASDRQKCLPKSLYIFSVRPSGARLNILCWFETTSFSTPDLNICLLLPGSHKAIYSPPMVVREGEGQGARDWFVWWRRFALRTSTGTFAYLKPSEASLNDWRRVLGAEDCAKEGDPPASLLGLGGSEQTSGGVAKLPSAEVDLPIGGYRGSKAEFAIPKGDLIDLGIGQFYPVADPKADGVLHLISLTKGGDCHKVLSEVEDSPCAVLLKLDTTSDSTRLGYNPVEQNGNWPKTAAEKKSVKGTDEFCGSYRYFVSQPFPVVEDNGARIVLLKRGNDERGSDYKTTLQARVTSTVQGQPPAEPVLFAISEDQEPLAFIKGAGSENRFLSLKLDGEGETRQLRVSTWAFPTTNAKVSRGKRGAAEPLKSKSSGICAGMDQSWLKRPVSVIGGERNVHLLFTRTRSLTTKVSGPFDERPKAVDTVYMIEGRLVQISQDEPCQVVGFFEKENNLALRTNQMDGKCVGPIWKRNGKCRKARREFWRRFLWTVVPAELDGDGKIDDVFVPDLFCPECSELRRNILSLRNHS